MNQSGFVISIAVLMLSACGNKSEKEAAVAPVSPPVTEHNTTVSTDPLISSPTKDKMPELTLPASTVITPTAPKRTGKPPKTNDGTKETLSGKAALESAASKPSSPEKTEIPITGNKGVEGGALSHEEGLALANKSGCLVCHKIETKLVGPAWRDVSKRYKGDPDAKARLIAKVKAGGKGNWTDVTGGIAMPPYSPRVSDENIEKLVIFVLSQ